MERKTSTKNAKKNGPDRDERLKAALKANMARRKAQARARASGDTSSNKDKG